MPSILCIENEPTAGVVLEDGLNRIGHQAVLAAGLDDAFLALERQPFDLIISDHRISGASGAQLLERLRQEEQNIPVILTSAHTSVEDVVLSMKRGVVDFLAKPIRLEALRSAVESALEVCRSRLEDEEAVGGLDSGRRRIVGETAALRGILETIRSVAPARATVLLHGETGTGKELFARALHEQSPRREQPFIVVNCAALPEALVESTLFGHERGAFTGATTRLAGAFERAHRGTLLLDEISEMRLDLQAKLLRAIQEREFERVGGTRPVQVDVRVVATTNRDLRAEVEAGRFRSDLFYRLSVVPIRTPALRDRAEDIPHLVRHFVEQFAVDLGLRPPRVPRETLEYLRTRSWPGNVRELENAVERAVLLYRGAELTPAAFAEESGASLREPPAIAGMGAPGQATAGLAMPGSHAQPVPIFDLRELERITIQRALQATQGHRARAARLLGISERTLRNKLNGGDREDPSESGTSLLTAA
jgi:DNA-binding NtrC family response regulator